MRVELVLDVVAVSPRALDKSYRIYVDEQLISERIFKIDANVSFIEETIVVDIPQGYHSVRLEDMSRLDSIRAKRLRVNGNDSPLSFNV